MPRLLLVACSLALAVPLHAATPAPKVPPGFRAELLLEAPQIEAPTALCVAPNGDVYFAEDPMDMSGPPTKNLDRIWLLKGGDPNKKILFADKLWAVMGLEVVRDKLYVVHAPHVTAFTLNADGTARERKELFDDLGPPVAGVPSFNDHIASGCRMGMDGWLYVSIGDKGIPRMTRKEKKGGSTHVAEGRWRHSKEGHHISLEGGGVIRFRPDGSGLEVFASGTRNHLDVPLDEHDRIFVRDNTDDGRGWWTRLMYLPPGAFLGYPWAYKQRPEETLPMVRDFGGGSPCGGWVYLDDGLPKDYRGRVFHCEWGQGKVFAVKLAPHGAGFMFVDQIAFLDPTGTGLKDFRPFSLRPTADGCGFYVTDWGYSGWLSKVKAGRLWKVTYTGSDVKPAPRGQDRDGIEQLIESLDHPAHSERLRAQRALVAHADRKKWQEAVGKLARDRKASPRTRIHALWALRQAHARDWVQAAALCLEAENPDLRLESVRALSSYRPDEQFKDAAAAADHAASVADALLKRATQDADPRVRAQAAAALPRVCRLSTLPDEGGGKPLIVAVLRLRDPARPRALLLHLDQERDPHVRFAIVGAIRRLGPWHEFADRLAKKEPGLLKGKPLAIAGLCAALAQEYDMGAVAVLRILLRDEDASVRQKAVATLARLYHERKPYAGTWWGTQPAGQAPPARVVAWEGTPQVRAAILGTLADRDAGVRRAAVVALVAARDPETLAPLVRRFEIEKEADTRADLVRAVAGLRTAAAVAFLGGVLADRQDAEAVRLEAIAGLEKAGNPEALVRIARVASASEPVAVQVRALEALGATRAGIARAACAPSLASREPAVRRAAAATLGKLGDSRAVDLLLPLLKDGELSVRSAAIQALGVLGSRAAVPALLQAAGNPDTQFDALLALARIPDPRALTAYLAGLGSKNPDLRQASRTALAEVRVAAAPVLEQLVRRGEVPATLLPELRSIYNTFAPVLSWHLIGPFPNDGKTHPPEKEVRLDAVYEGAGKKVRWRAHPGDPRAQGKVNLGSLFTPNADVVAYGHAVIESDSARDAQLLLGSDDTLAVWLNGKQVFAFNDNRGWRYDQDRVNVHLQKGKNELMIRCGNTGGPWEFSVAVSGDAAKYAFLKGGAKKLDLEDFRAFARKTPGDPERGRKLFFDVKGLACVKCHAVNGVGGQVGPDLADIGLRYKREDLMTSILEPSRIIAQGYETIVVVTAKGQTLTGVFKGESGDAVNLTDNEGKAHRIPRKEVEERAFSPVSLMPNGLNEGMTPQDFTDLIAFLESRREQKAVPKK